MNTVNILTDHKVGSQLIFKLVNILKQNCKYKIKVKVFYLFNINFNKNEKYIFILRHPKEIIISGYLYHKKCNEKWAINKNGFYYDTHLNKIIIPNSSNIKYIKFAKTFSKDIPYQQKLNNMKTNDGIIYEMKNVSYLTIIGMYNMMNKQLIEQKNNNNLLVIKLEDLLFNYKNTMNNICKYICININEIYIKIKHLDFLDNNDSINSHITNIDKKKNRYLEYWNNEIEKEFINTYPSDILTILNYI